MKLFFIPDACSLTINIALREADISFIMSEVDYAGKKLSDGTDFRCVSAKGYVPALQLADGRCLTEVIAILDHIDFLAPDVGLLGRRGTDERQVALEWLTFVATEIHKSFSPLFRPGTPHEFFEHGLDHVRKRLAVVEDHLSNQPFLSGVAPAAADYYLFVVCRWMADVGLCIDDWPSIADHSAGISARRTVQLALSSENL